MEKTIYSFFTAMWPSNSDKSKAPAKQPSQATAERIQKVSSAIPDASSDIPNEILIHIFTFLYIPDLAQASKVCTLWCNLTKNNIIWQPLVQRDFPSIMIAEPKKISYFKSYKRATAEIKETVIDPILESREKLNVIQKLGWPKDHGTNNTDEALMAVLKTFSFGQGLGDRNTPPYPLANEIAKEVKATRELELSNSETHSKMLALAEKHCIPCGFAQLFMSYENNNINPYAEYAFWHFNNGDRLVLKWNTLKENCKHLPLNDINFLIRLDACLKVGAERHFSSYIIANETSPQDFEQGVFYAGNRPIVPLSPEDFDRRYLLCLRYEEQNALIDSIISIIQFPS